MRRDKIPASIEMYDPDPLGYVHARKSPRTGKYSLFYRGTNNPVEINNTPFVGEFDTAQQARNAFKYEYLKNSH